MRLYIKYSADIYSIYLKYIAKEDIHVYSIDEAFLDVTHYHKMYHICLLYTSNGKMTISKWGIGMDEFFSYGNMRPILRTA